MSDPMVLIFCLSYVTAGVATMAAAAGFFKSQRALQMSPIRTRTQRPHRR